MTNATNRGNDQHKGAIIYVEIHTNKILDFSQYNIKLRITNSQPMI